MKHLILLSLIILSATILLACSGNNNNKTSTLDNKNDPPSTATSSSGNASWSCNLDGQAITGNIIDNGLQYDHQSNVAYIDEVDEGKELLFYLSDTKSPSSLGVHTLRFSVPAKTGASSFGQDENGWGIEVDIIINNGHTARYNSDSFTINVTDLTATRTSGTFAGKFTLHGNITDTDKKEISVTDGKFDIPIAKN